ncbi:MAG: hypothetical protein WBP09_04750, partial [Propionicimonas sp.]
MTSFIGICRTEVAVGTLSEASMFAAVRMGAPRRVVRVGSAAVRACGTWMRGRSAEIPLPEPGPWGPDTRVVDGSTLPTGVPPGVAGAGAGVSVTTTG